MEIATSISLMLITARIRSDIAEVMGDGWIFYATSLSIRRSITRESGEVSIVQGGEQT